MAAKPKKVDPTTLSLDDLRTLAARIISPEPGQHVVIGVMNEDELAEYEFEEEEPDMTNVVKLFPFELTKSEAQKQGQQETIEKLELLIDMALRGEIRDFVAVLGVEENEERTASISTFHTTGVLCNLSSFLGGLSIAKHRLLAKVEPEEDYCED